MVVLLPDPDTQAIGRAVVSTPLGASTELSHERAATRVVTGQPPGAPFTLLEEQVHQLFDDALAAQPPAPRHFLLYFFTATDTLTPASDILLRDVLAFVKSRPAPDVTVIGHTDTADSAQANVALGHRRATAIRDRLVATGLDPGRVSVASHGEADLLVRTPDDTPEARNRRVEVSVR
jgi:outer membrane protein OmpA-like peptidoglycan-associated protein